VSRFPLNFKTDRKLHLRALPLSPKCSTLQEAQEAGVWLSFLIGVAAYTAQGLLYPTSSLSERQLCALKPRSRGCCCQPTVSKVMKHERFDGRAA
jgi:hypothetical protein